MVLLAEKNKPVYKTYEDFPAEDLYLYAGIDCITTSELMAKTWPTITATPNYTFVKQGQSEIKPVMSILDSMSEFTMPAHEFICDMEINGIRYNVERNAEIARQMGEELGNLEEAIFLSIGRNLDLNSGKILRSFIYEEQGFSPLSFTKTGEAATDGAALQELAKVHPEIKWLPLLAKRNDINSAFNTFIRTYVEDHVKRDGRIHPSYNLHGTSSFRITGDRPNLTQLPRPKHGYNIRELYYVDAGNVFLAFDFSSAEVKILGALCRDPMLLRAIREGLDFHSFSAANMHGIPYEDIIGVLADPTHPLFKKYKGMRQDAKVLTFSILYGSSPAGIGMQMGISKEQADQLMTLYFKTYPGIERFVADAHAMAELNQYIVTPFGQRKMEYGTRPEFKYTAIYNAAKRNAQNVSVQGPTSSIGLLAFTALNQAIKPLGARSLCTVYDSIEIECPLDKAAEVIEKAFYYMNDYPQTVFDWLDFPIGVEGEIGPNWGTTQLVHRGVTQKEIKEIVCLWK